MRQSESPISEQLEQNIIEFNQTFNRIEQEVGRVIVGMRDIVRRVAPRIPEAQALFTDKLRQRLVEALGNASDDRILQEVAVFANAREAGLIVVGSRGESGLRAQAVGSTALKVLWQSLTPVLMVRQPVDVAYRKVLVATDLSERSLHVVRTALEVFPKAATTLLHAWRGEFETTLELTGATADARRRYVAAEGEAAAAALEDQRMRALGGSRRRLARFIAHGHPLPVIQKAVAELQPDVVVLGKHSGPRWQEQVLGSVVQNLLQQLKTDVLVVA